MAAVAVVLTAAGLLVLLVVAALLEMTGDDMINIRRKGNGQIQPY